VLVRSLDQVGRAAQPRDHGGEALGGLAAVERALALSPDHGEAMMYKSLLLKVKATLQPNEAARRKLLDEADELRRRAMEALKRRSPTN
jgi:hypothetical protein